MGERVFHVTYRRQMLTRDLAGRAVWEAVATPRALRAAETALLFCDVWDRHWSRGAIQRLEAMIPRMDALARALRARGARILHAPSETMAFYEGHPARERVRAAPPVEPPLEPLRFGAKAPSSPGAAADEGGRAASTSGESDPPLPIDASDGGSDTGETAIFKAWSRQHPGIFIDPERDGISDDGCEVYNFLRQCGIRHLLIAGVHTNMCVLHRSFAIKAMVRRGMETALVRDLTDAMYNPARPPYVSHDEGTRLVVEYIEKFWCPTVTSEELLCD